MREIVPQRKAQANPWLWACVTLGACLAAFVVYDLMSSASSTDALVDVKAKAAAREKELQRQVDHLKQSLGETDGRLASANLRIQELVTERERRKNAVNARNEMPRPNVATTYQSDRPSGIPLGRDIALSKAQLLADAWKARDEGSLYVALLKFRAILEIDAKDIGASEGLNSVMNAIVEVEAKKAADAAASGGSR